MSQTIHRTQLYEAYSKTVKTITFAGFEMPLYYKDVAPEHLAVRNSVGIFDISHMGRMTVSGPDSEIFLNRVVTNDVALLTPNSAQYSVMCNEKGGIIDDFVVYKLEHDKLLVVYNAGNRQKDFDWFKLNSSGFNVEVNDVSDAIAMLAVQGPNAEKTLQKISKDSLSAIARFKCGHSQLAGIDVFLARTGYTGEDGFEVFIWNASLANPDPAIRVWKAILEAGSQLGLQPCGLGARDTLRLEAGLCLYGNDIDENTTPLEAGLGFVVKLQKSSFIGRDSLVKQKAEGPRRKRVGVLITDQGIPRQGFDIFSSAGEKIGQLTSGTFSPLLKRGIGMGYVRTDQAQQDSVVSVSIRGRTAKGKIAAFPLYDPGTYGFRRKSVGG